MTVVRTPDAWPPAAAGFDGSVRFTGTRGSAWEDGSASRAQRAAAPRSQSTTESGVLDARAAELKRDLF